MAKVTVTDGKVMYRKWMKTCEIAVDDLVWAYIQREDATAKLCCGQFSVPIGRVIVIDKAGNKEIFQYEGMEEPKKLLEELQKANPQMAIGYTKENRVKFGVA